MLIGTGLFFGSRSDGFGVLGLGDGGYITKEILPEYLSQRRDGLNVVCWFVTLPSRAWQSVGRDFLLHSQKQAILSIRLVESDPDATLVSKRNPGRPSELGSGSAPDPDRQPLEDLPHLADNACTVRLQKSRPRLLDRPPTRHTKQRCRTPIRRCNSSSERG